MTTLAQQAWLDQEDQFTTDMIRRYGWRIVYVLASDEVAADCAPDCPCQRGEPVDEPPTPAFAYTVGLFGLGHPELLIFSVPPEVAGLVLNDLGRRVSAGANLLPGQVLDLPGWAHRVVTEQLPDPGVLVTAANSFYQRPDVASVPVLQVGYDDRAGRFPWERGYDDRSGRQPRPGSFLA